VKRLLPALLACFLACNATATVVSEPPPGAETPDAGTADEAGAPRSCDPFTPRSPAPQLLVGPTDFEKEVLGAIARAETSLKIFIYEIDRKSVLDALVAAKNRGVDVSLVVDRGKSAPAKQRLRTAGITVKDSPSEFVFQHAKVIVVDEAEALILSGNLNDYTFDRERNYGIVDRDPSDVADVLALFARDSAGTGAVDLSCTKLVVSPVNARARLEGLVKGAKTTLDLSVMYVTDPGIAAAIKERKAAGVAVRLLLADPNWMTSNPQTAQSMAASGIPVRYFKSLDLHAKLVIADDSAFVGSENFSKNSLDNNREVGVFATEPDVVAGIRTQFEADWNEGTAP
jgi:phosphatidylserine/phosphatidylglycerophosphate/cardiolipin synthase-like enzyme